MIAKNINYSTASQRLLIGTRELETNDGNDITLIQAYAQEVAMSRNKAAGRNCPGNLKESLQPTSHRVFDSSNFVLGLFSLPINQDGLVVFTLAIIVILNRIDT